MRRIRKGKSPRHLEDWKRDFKAAKGREPLYDDLIGTEEYIFLKKELLKEQGYICCYCEKEVGVRSVYDCDIEHFMPRHPDKRELTPQECKICEKGQLDYSNMFVSCRGEETYEFDHCNHRKDNWYDFETCVSPASEEAERLFGFRLNGKIFSLNANQKAEAMKKHLNLDTHVLQEQRKAAFDTVYETEFSDDLENLLDDEDYIMDTIELYRARDTHGRYTPFCSMITFCLERYIL